MTQYTTETGTQPQAEVQHEARTTRRNEGGGELYMMTEIGDGVFVQWSQCARCLKKVSECTSCAGGPQEPAYITRWRTQRFTKSFAERGIDPRATPHALRSLTVVAQAAANAAYGDSNDNEIDLLRDALETALDLLGVRMPAGVDPYDEDDDEGECDEREAGLRAMMSENENLTQPDDEPTALEQTLGIKPEPLVEQVDDGLDAAIAAARDSKEDTNGNA